MDERGPWDDVPGGLGLVLDSDRGSLPYQLIHGESLVACAAWALGESGVTPVDASVPWEALAAEEEPVVLHDALCPMTPPEFIAACVERSLATGAVVVGVRPVTDTVKVVSEGLVGETVDREGLLAVASPLVLPAEVAGALPGMPVDLARTVTELAAAGHAVETLLAPPQGRRVTSPDGLRVLEALTDPRGDRPAPRPPGR